LELSEIFHCEIADLLTNSSNRSMDQARQLEQLLKGLDGYERAELLNLVERMLKWKAHKEE
ncbi:transcriptional regulator, partial [Avibacterium paragallinarum]